VPEFHISLSTVSSVAATTAKYLMRLHRKSAELDRTIFKPFTDDMALLEALAKLGIPEPQQQQILSALHQQETATLTVDVSEDVIQLFGWPFKK
jgi:hypothetical protein